MSRSLSPGFWHDTYVLSHGEYFCDKLTFGVYPVLYSMYPPSFPLFCTRVHTEYARPFVLFFLSRHPLTSFSPEKDFAVHIFMWVASSAVSGLGLLSRKKPSSVSGPHGRLGRRRIRDAHSLPPLALICCGYVQEQETHDPLFFFFFWRVAGGKSNKIRRNTWGQSNPFDGSIGRGREIFRSSVVPKSDVCVANHVCSSVAVNETRMQSHYENASARSSSAAAALGTSWGRKKKRKHHGLLPHRDDNLD